MRLFVSLPLDEPMRRYLAGIAAGRLVEEQDHDVRWVRPDNLHVTLKFLGEVPDARVLAVTDALSRICSPGPVSMTAAPPDPSRHRGRARVIAAEIEDVSGQLRRLQEAIEAELGTLGFPRERRRFWPHVTIGRSRRGVHVTGAGRGSRGPTGLADHFALMSSTLGAAGPSYVPIATFPLT